MSRLNVILLAAAALQLAVFLIITLTSDDGPERAAPTPLVTWTAEDVTAIAIENPDEDEPLRLEKRGDDWVIASAYDYPARTTLIADDDESPDDRNGVLDKLVRIEVDRTVVRQRENHAVLHVADDDFERRVTFEGTDGAVLGKLYLARSPNGRTTYVRRDGEDEVWETDGITVWNTSADPASWVTATFIDENQDDVVKLTAHHAASGIDHVFERRTHEDGSDPENPVETHEWWQTAPTEVRADEKALKDVLGKCCRMSLTGIAGKTDPEGAYDAADVFTVELADGKRIAIHVGAERDDGDNHVKIDGNEYRFLVSSWSVRGLHEFDPEKLVEKAEEPAEETDERVPADGEKSAEDAGKPGDEKKADGDEKRDDEAGGNG